MICMSETLQASSRVSYSFIQKSRSVGATPYGSHLRSLSLRSRVCHQYVRLLGLCYKTGRLKRTSQHSFLDGEHLLSTSIRPRKLQNMYWVTTYSRLDLAESRVLFDIIVQPRDWIQYPPIHLCDNQSENISAQVCSTYPLSVLESPSTS